LIPQEEKKPRKKKTLRGCGNMELKDISPLTTGQHIMMESFIRGSHVVADGVAGTGKTYVATYLGLHHLFKRQGERLIFLRSLVATREVGFLPGSLIEKTAPYWSLYKDHVNELCNNGTAWDIMTNAGLIEFETTSFIRGKTWNNAVIIVDEYQNLNPHEIYSTLTRVGNNSQIILCGDNKQTDLPKKEDGWSYLQKLVANTSDLFDVVTFGINDIVRSEFVKQIIIADSRLK
jgi:phosphate starvation-inducible PhoH-like protein